jgi:hypothetical protein
MALGHELYVVGAYAARSAFEAAFDDYLARLTVSRNGNPWNVGVQVQPADGALAELLEAGVIHESLVEEPRATDLQPSLRA